MRTLPFDCVRCKPLEPDHYCKNCKRWSEHPEQVFGPRTAIQQTINSKDHGCIYIPVSLIGKNV